MEREKGHIPWNKGKSKYPQLNDREWLYQKYWIEELSSEEIAKIIGCASSAVLRALRRLNIPRRTNSEAKKGKLNPLWRKHHSEGTKTKQSNAQKGKPGLKGNKNPIFGKHPSEGTRGKMSEAKRGEKNPNYGKPRSEKTKRKISESERGKEVSQKTKNKLKQSRKRQRISKNNTKIELILKEIAEKNTDRIKYTGDGSFWIETPEMNINPDFIVIGKKIAIEANGEYWHYSLNNYKKRENSGVNKRKELLKKVGWKLIVFWGEDLLREDAETYVLSVLKRHKIMPQSSLLTL